MKLGPLDREPYWFKPVEGDDLELLLKPPSPREAIQWRDRLIDESRKPNELMFSTFLTLLQDWRGVIDEEGASFPLPQHQKAEWAAEVWLAIGTVGQETVALEINKLLGLNAAEERD